MGCDCLMVRQGDGVIVVATDGLQEGQIEPLGPDHSRRLSLQIIISQMLAQYFWSVLVPTFFLWKI